MLLPVLLIIGHWFSCDW